MNLKEANKWDYFLEEISGDIDEDSELLEDLK